MVRRLIPILATLFLLAVVLLLAAGLWVLRTPQGTRWFLETAAGATGARLEIERVEGRLAGDLRLEGMRLRREGMEADLDLLLLKWRPGRLLRGELAVSELALEGGKLTAGPAPPSDKEEPPRFYWPRLSGWALRLEGAIERLRLADIAFQTPGREARRLDKLEMRLGWDGGTLEVDGLEAAGEGYSLQGEAAAGFARPLLRLDLRLGLPRAVADLDGLSLTADLEEGAEALLSGPVELRGRKGQKAILDLSAQIALDREALRLRRFELTHASWGARVRGEGEIALSDPFAFSLSAEAKDIDLARTTGVAAEVDGRVEVSGTPGDYGGRFEASGRGATWRRGSLAGRFSGTREKIALRDLDGAWLRGSLRGEATVGWAEGLRVEAMLEGRGFDPAVFDPRWSGTVNLDVEGSLAKLPGEALRAEVRGKLLESTLRGRPLTGRADLSVLGKDLRVAALELHGDGFDLAAHGRLAERLEVGADVRRLGGLVPGATGSLQAKGWLRWREGVAAASLELRGEGLSVAGAKVATLRGDLNRPEGAPWTLRLQAGGLAYDRVRLEFLELALDGTAGRHRLSLKAGGPRGRGELAAEGGWRAGLWSGTVERLQGETRAFGAWRLVEPVALQAGPKRLRVEHALLEGEGQMEVGLAADLAGSPLRGTLEGAWRGIDLVLMRPWLPEKISLTGRSSGEANLRLLGPNRIDVRGRIEGACRLALGDFSATFSRMEGTLDGDAGGLAGRLEAELEEGARLTAELHSEEPPPAMPRSGTLEASWEGIDLALVRPWLPSELRLEGKLSGRMAGEWLPGRRLSLAGSAGIGQGEVSWQREEGEVAFALQAAAANWRWQGQSLRGDLDLTLAELGRIGGSFSIPLPARLPTALQPEGPIALRLGGKMREQGLLSAVFPGLLRESEGDLEAELTVGGAWGSPVLGGRIRLSGAKAYLPAAGIEIEEVEAKAELSGDRVRLVSFSARSGPGRIEGEGEVRLKGWEVAEYEATLKGERFRAVNLPERQLLVTPDLSLSGTRDRLAVRGRLDLPELIVIERKRQEMVRESPDVVVVGREAGDQRRELPLELDLGVKVVLGERVLIKVAGVDARLAGELDLAARDHEDIAANGEIRVAEGIYTAYGVQLKIARGRLLYAGGPVDRPTLDILAQRTVGEVKAGVQVGGTPQSPVVKLVSEPAMPDTDVLSYIVLGRPLGGGGQQAGLLMSAAGALLSRGESTVLQDRLKRRLGVDVLAVESGGGDVTGSMVTVGKYLSPRLFVSYGQSLFAGTGEARLRYELGKRWELESKMGVKSGVDLFYKIEFK
jgi:translocation and assembly module TamB